MHPSLSGVHDTALQSHSSAGPGHPRGAQHFVRVYTVLSHSNSFGGPSTSHEHARPVDTNDSEQCVLLLPVRAKQSGAQLSCMQLARRDGGV